MSYQNILVEQENSLSVVTVNRPQALNALNTATLLELTEAFEEISGKRGIRSVILTGAGDKAFIAGADISEMVKKDPLQAKQFAVLGHELTKKIEQLPQPVIAAVNGYALGGGCEIALACDMRVAAENAKFGQPEVGLGIIPGWGATQRLPRLIGKGLASELLLTGRIISAQEALRMGLVNHVVPVDLLMHKTRELAETVAAKGMTAIELTKSVIRRGENLDLDKALAMEADSFALCFATEDQREGMEAFLAKRKPNFESV